MRPRDTASGLGITLSLVVALGVAAPSALAQEAPELEGTPLPPYAKVFPVDRGPVTAEPSTNGLPNVMLTGYWPPTNEMLRAFSQNLDQNPGGWVGENWEGRGYNIYSFFPEFPGGLGKGEGDFEVDYQDTSGDWWPLVAQLEPIAIITFGRSGNDHDWELEGGHRMYELSQWTADYEAPTRPTAELPIADETPGTERMSTLPLDAIIDAIEAEVPALYPYATTIDTSKFLCNFAGYHANWYHEDHLTPGDPAWNAAAGHIHVGYAMTLEEAVLATEVTVRTLTGYLDEVIPVGDYDHDGEVDLQDFEHFPSCVTGPTGLSDHPACRAFDAELDGDVDLLDFARIQVVFDGSDS